MRFLSVLVLFLIFIPTVLLAAPAANKSALPNYKQPIREFFADAKSEAVLTAGRQRLDDYAKILVSVAKGERKLPSKGESSILYWKPEIAPFGYAGTFVVLHVKDSSGKKVLAQFVNSDGETNGFYEKSKGLGLFLSMDRKQEKPTSGGPFVGRLMSTRGHISFSANGKGSDFDVPSPGDGLVLLGGHVNGQSGEDLVAALEEEYKRCGQSKGNMLDFIAHVLAPEPISSIPAPHTTLDVGVPTILSKINPGAMASCGKGI